MNSYSLFLSPQVYSYLYLPFFLESNHKTLYFINNHKVNSVTCILWHILLFISKLLYLVINKKIIVFVIKFVSIFIFANISLNNHIRSKKGKPNIFVFILGTDMANQVYLHLYLGLKIMFVKHWSNKFFDSYSLDIWLNRFGFPFLFWPSSEHKWWRLSSNHTKVLQRRRVIDQSIQHPEYSDIKFRGAYKHNKFWALH